jgi:hypothetical protein
VASATGRSVNASTPPHFGDVVESRSRGNAIRPPTAEAGGRAAEPRPARSVSMTREQRDALKRRILAQHPHLAAEILAERG